MTTYSSQGFVAYESPSYPIHHHPHHSQAHPHQQAMHAGPSNPASPPRQAHPHQFQPSYTYDQMNSAAADPMRAMSSFGISNPEQASAQQPRKGSMQGSPLVNGGPAQDFIPNFLAASSGPSGMPNFPMMNLPMGIQQFPGMPQMPAFPPPPPTQVNGQSPKDNTSPQIPTLPVFGMSLPDYGMYAAAMAAASMVPAFPGMTSGGPGPLVVQQSPPTTSPPQMSTTNSSSGPTTYASVARQTANAQKAQMSPTNASMQVNGSSPQFGMVASPSSPPSSSAGASGPYASAVAAAAALAAATGVPNANANANAGPAAQAMSSLSSSSAHLQPPMSPLTSYSPNFASPAMTQAGFDPSAAAAAGLNLANLYGFVPGFNMSGLGMSLPGGMSPNLGSAPMSEVGSQQSAGAMYGSQPALPRTVYLGNLPGDASVDELLSLVRYGPIENVKILPDKSCAFISFLDPGTAAAFHSDALLRKLQLHNQDLKVGWGKPTVIPAAVLAAVQGQGATRNVYLGNLDEEWTEQTLRDDLSRFGHIDQVKIVRDKNIGFVHFLSISTAIKVVQELPKDANWQGRRVNYGKDRCAYVPRNQHQQQQHNQMAAVMASQAASQVTGLPHQALYNAGMSPNMSLSPNMSPMMQGAFMDPSLQAQRTIYLGNLHPETTAEDICNTIRGGILQEIRVIPDKHICFITFVMAESALTLFNYAVTQGITIRARRLKVGWGKGSGPCPPGIAAIVAAGGSRNVYIGNIDDWETYTLDKISDDLSIYGEIEQVNALQEKSCAFVNYTKISSAVKAIEALKQHEEYGQFKIAYGKDRVGNMSRAPLIRHPRTTSRNRDDSNGDSQYSSSSPSMSGPSDDLLTIPPHSREASNDASRPVSADTSHEADLSIQDLGPQLDAVQHAAEAVSAAEKHQQKLIQKRENRKH